MNETERLARQFVEDVRRHPLQGSIALHPRCVQKNVETPERERHAILIASALAACAWGLGSVRNVGGCVIFTVGQQNRQAPADHRRGQEYVIDERQTHRGETRLCGQCVAENIEPITEDEPCQWCGKTLEGQRGERRKTRRSVDSLLESLAAEAVDDVNNVLGQLVAAKGPLAASMLGRGFEPIRSAGDMADLLKIMVGAGLVRKVKSGPGLKVELVEGER